MRHVGAIFIVFESIPILDGSGWVVFLIGSVVRLKVGSRGEIFTTKEIRNFLGIKPSSEVIGIITKDGLLIMPRRSLKSLLKKRKTLIRLSVEEFEALSEEIQRTLSQ